MSKWGHFKCVVAMNALINWALTAMNESTVEWKEKAVITSWKRYSLSHFFHHLSNSKMSKDYIRVGEYYTTCELNITAQPF